MKYPITRGELVEYLRGVRSENAQHAADLLAADEREIRFLRDKVQRLASEAASLKWQLTEGQVVK